MARLLLGCQEASAAELERKNQLAHVVRVPALERYAAAVELAKSDDVEEDVRARVTSSCEMRTALLGKSAPGLTWTGAEGGGYTTGLRT